MTAARFEAEILPLTPKLRTRARQFVRAAGDAEDLVQETLLRAWKAWGKSEIQNPWCWIWLIMRNVFLDRRRDASRWSGLVEGHTSDIADVRAEAPAAPDAGVSAGADDDLRSAIEQLKGAQRTVIELHLVGLDDETMARHLQVSVKTVRSAACKARARLRAAL